MQSGADTARPNADDLVPVVTARRLRTRKWRPCGARATGCPRHDRASRGRRLPCRPRSPDRTEDYCRSARFAWTRTSLGADRKDPRRGGRALCGRGRRDRRGPRHPNAIRGALLAIAELGVTILCSCGPADSALWIHRLAVRHARRASARTRPRRTHEVVEPGIGSWPRFRESPPTLPVRCSAGSGASTAYSVPVLNAGLKSTASALSGPMPLATALLDAPGRIPARRSSRSGRVECSLMSPWQQ